MSKYELKTPKQAGAVVGACKRIEEIVAGAYKKVEDAAVSGSRQAEGKFMGAFLEKADDGGQSGASSPVTRDIILAAETGADIPPKLAQRYNIQQKYLRASKLPSLSREDMEALSGPRI